MSMVPYGMPMGAPMLDPRLQAGMSLGKFAWQNRDALSGAFKNLRKRGRPSKSKAAMRKKAKAKFSPKNVGHPGGADTTKDTDVVNDSSLIAYDTRSFHVTDITALDQATSANSISRRQRQIVFLKGFKICEEISNNQDNPLYYHIAVIAPHGNTNIPNTTDFFRSTGGTERSADFGTALSSIEFRCLPINTDKYTVLWHQRIMLNAVNNTASFAARDGRNYGLVEKYIPMNRQIRYDSTNAGSCENPVYVVHWADEFQSPGGATAVAGAYSKQRRYVMYFKEPKQSF